MSCEEYIVWISGHLDGTNQESEEQLLTEHLASCPHCRELLLQMEQNDATIGGSLLVPPASISRSVMQKVNAEVKQKRKRLWNYVLSGVATAAVLCLVLTGTLGLPGSYQDSDTTLASTCDPGTPVEAHYQLRTDNVHGSGTTSEQRTEAPIPTEAMLSDEGNSPLAKGIVANEGNCIFIYTTEEIVPSFSASDNLYFIISQMNEAAYSYHSDSTHQIIGFDFLTRTEIEQLNAEDSVEFVSDPSSTEYMVIYCTKP